MNDLPDDVTCDIAIYADHTTLYSKCDQASDPSQQLDEILVKQKFVNTIGRCSKECKKIKNCPLTSRFQDLNESFHRGAIWSLPISLHVL